MKDERGKHQTMMEIRHMRKRMIATAMAGFLIGMFFIVLSYVLESI